MNDCVLPCLVAVTWRPPQAWKEQLYPLLKQHLADHVDSSISYLVLYHEAAVANLLEVGSAGQYCSPAVSFTYWSTSTFQTSHTMRGVPRTGHDEAVAVLLCYRYAYHEPRVSSL